MSGSRRAQKGTGTIERITKLRKDGSKLIRFRAVVKVDGKPICGPLVEKRSDARPALYRKVTDLAAANRVRSQERLSTCVPDWIDSRHDRRINTNDLARVAWASASPFLANLTAGEVTAEHLEVWMSGISVAPAKKSRYRREIVAILRDLGAKIPEFPAIRIPIADVRVLTKDEQATLLAAATWPRTRLAIMILLDTGIRSGEACGLLHEDVQDGGIWIRRSRTMIRHKPVTGETKTDRSKGWVPLTSRLKSQLGPPRTGYVLALGGIPWNTTNLRRAILKVALDAQLGRVRTKDLRSTAVTNLLRAGVDPATVATITRHSVDMVLKIYYRTSNEAKLEAVAKLEKFMEG